MDDGLSMGKSPSQTMEKSTGKSPISFPSYQYCEKKRNRNISYLRKKVYTPLSASAATDNIFLDTRKTIICKLNRTTGKICPNHR